MKRLLIVLITTFVILITFTVSASASKQGVPNPYKVLSGGVTLIQAKESMGTIQDLEKAGWSKAGATQFLEDEAKSFGTTLDEVNRCPDVPWQDQIAAQTSTKNNKNAKTKHKIAKKTNKKAPTRNASIAEPLTD